MKREKILTNLVRILAETRGLLGNLKCEDERAKEDVKHSLDSALNYAECERDMIHMALTSVDSAPHELDGLELLKHLIILSQEKNEAEFIAGAAKHLAQVVKKNLVEEMEKENLFRLFFNGAGYSVIVNDGKISLYHDVDGTEQKIDI